MKNKLTKIVIASLIAIITVTGMTYPASAYVFNSYKHKNSTIYYYYDNWVGSRAISYFSTGASAWRAKTTEATVKHYSSSSKTGYDVYMCAGNVSGVTWDGLTQTTYNNSTKYVISQTVTLNMSNQHGMIIVH